MTYIESFELEFRKKLEAYDNDDNLVKWVCERIVESYRNGIAAGQKGKAAKREGESRQSGSTGKAA